MKHSVFVQARELLQLRGEFTTRDLKLAYRRAVQAAPPDRDPDGFRRVRAAYDLLRAPLEGRQSWLSARYPHCPPPLAKELPRMLPGSNLARTALQVLLQGTTADELLPNSSLDRVDAPFPRPSSIKLNHE